MIAKQSRVQFRQRIVVQVDHLEFFGGEKRALFDVHQQVMAEINAVEFADVTERFGIDFGESVVRHVENLEDILDRVKKGHFDVRNIVTGQIQSHDIGGRWVRGCSVVGQDIQIIVA